MEIKFCSFDTDKASRKKARLRKSKTNVQNPFVLLVGGRSSEYNDSLNSYFAIREEVLSSSKHAKRLSAIYYISRTGRIRLHIRRLPHSEESLISEGNPLDWTEMITRLAQPEGYVFSLLHGKEGEDGCFQGISKILNIPGNFGTLSSAFLTISKWIISSLVIQISEGTIHCPKTWILSSRCSDEEIKTVIRELNGRPAVIKPNSLGSSFLAEPFNSLTFNQLKKQLDLIRPHDNLTLVQTRVQGTEYTCGIIEKNGKPKVLPVAEVLTQRRFFGYKEKHEGGLARLLFRNDDREGIEKIKSTSIKLFTAIGMNSMGRFDFLKSDEDGKIYFLEANSLPGLGRSSIFPRMLKKIKMSRLDLLDLCITNFNNYETKLHDYLY